MHYAVQTVFSFSVLAHTEKLAHDTGTSGALARDSCSSFLSWFYQYSLSWHHAEDCLMLKHGAGCTSCILCCASSSQVFHICSSPGRHDLQILGEREVFSSFPGGPWWGPADKDSDWLSSCLFFVCLIYYF